MRTRFLVLAASMMVTVYACGGDGEDAVPPGAAPGTSVAPAAGPVGDPQIGKALYASHCASCHGERGAGDGPAAGGFDPAPKNLVDPTVQGRPDAQLANIVLKGGPVAGLSENMPAFGGTLDDAQVRDIVAYLRTLAVR